MREVERRHNLNNVPKHALQVWTPENPDDDDPLQGLFVFSQRINSLLYTYSLLLLISIPAVPKGWTIRTMCGSWWLFCVLATNAYRASMTSILANPAPRVRINTIEELLNSGLSFGGWGEENKQFFLTSLDEGGKEIGTKFVVVYDTDSIIESIANGTFAYYDNKYYLTGAIAKQVARQKFNDSASKGTMHIMDTCVINMPISLGLVKNSPLKPKMDVFIRRIIEAGLTQKWLTDVMAKPNRAVAAGLEEEVKALMDLRKLYGGIVTLLIGYFISSVVLAGENLHWYFTVVETVDFDKYTKQIFSFRLLNKESSEIQSETNN